MDAVTVIALVTAVVAAVRSTWSPCGASMFSTITPLTEASRQRTYGVTVGWFLAGALLGGLVFGVLGAGLAVVVGALDLSTDTALVAAGVLALAGAALDARVAGVTLPGHGRQVNETWLTRFRSWVYGGGFGFQIGTGLATYITTAAVYLTVLLAALTASPATALLVGLVFGGIRGLAIFAGAHITTREQLTAFHRRFESAREPSRLVTIGAQVSLAAVAAGLSSGVPGLALVALLAAASARAIQPDVVRVRPGARGVTVPVDAPTTLDGRTPRTVPVEVG